LAECRRFHNLVMSYCDAGEVSIRRESGHDTADKKGNFFRDTRMLHEFLSEDLPDFHKRQIVS